MPATVTVDYMTVIHMASNGVSPAFPDTCKTPAPPVPSPVPIPYPNIAMSTDLLQGTIQVKADKQSTAVKDSIFVQSTGDEAGVAGGVVSGVIKMKAEFVSFSFKVKFEGKFATKAFDMMLHNDKNTPPAPVLQPPAPPIP